MAIHRLNAIGDQSKAPKCERCGKLLVFGDKETAPICRGCSIILKMKTAISELEKNTDKQIQK